MDIIASHYDLRHWNSREVAPAERVETWRYHLGGLILPSRFDPLPECPVFVNASMRILPGVRFGVGELGPSVTERPRDIVAGENDDIFMLRMISGAASVIQDGCEVVLGAGDATLTSCSAPSRYVLPATARIFCLRMPQSSLTPLVPDLVNRVMHIIPARNEGLDFLFDYALPLVSKTRAARGPSLGARALRQVVAGHIVDLAALAIGASREGKMEGAAGGLRAARLAAAKRHIAGNLCKDLSVAAIAARQNLSVRQLERLFEEEGITFRQFVLEQRLLQVRRLLADPHRAEDSIASLAGASGFGDLSHFNRSFRRRFGATPSDIRKHGASEN